MHRPLAVYGMRPLIYPVKNWKERGHSIVRNRWKLEQEARLTLLCILRAPRHSLIKSQNKSIGTVENIQLIEVWIKVKRKAIFRQCFCALCICFLKLLGARLNSANSSRNQSKKAPFPFCSLRAESETFPFLAPFHTGSKKKRKLERKQTSHICGKVKSEVANCSRGHFRLPKLPFFCLKNHFCRRSTQSGAKSHSIFININLSCDRAHRRFFVNL